MPYQIKNRRQLGSVMEQAAASFLEKRGYRILEKNYRCRFGEIDLIAYDPAGSALCFIEVKYRSGSRYGDPSEAVTLKKQRTIRCCAKVYLAFHQEYAGCSVRFDVVSILGPSARIIKDAF